MYLPSEIPSYCDDQVEPRLHVVAGSQKHHQSAEYIEV